MFCTECGQAHADDARTCAHCGARLLLPRGVDVDVDSHLVPAILVTLCCCVPFGVPAIVYASGVAAKVASGDLEGAREASRKARLWSWIGFGVGLGFWILYLIFGVIAEAVGGLD